MTVEVYTTKTCPYCFAAKDLLQQKGISYKEYDVSYDISLRANLMEKTGRRTVPQIFIDQEHVGGFTDLIRYFK